MSLKAFHMFFIAIATMLVLGFGDWSLRVYLAQGTSLHWLVSVICLMAVSTLLGYFGWFVKKTSTGGFK